MIKILIKITLFFLISIAVCFASPIKEIDIKGNQRISSETIKLLGNIKINTQYNKNDLDILIKKLYETQFFKNVSLNIKDNTLFIKLEENPIIEDVKIDGIKGKQLNEYLLEQISLKNRKSFTNFLLQRDINLIKNILKTSGYYFVEITPLIKINEELNSVRLIYEIDQGPKAKIKKISFIGEKKIKDKKLLEVIASEEHRFWKFISNKVYLDQSRINLDKRLIENYYKNQGYYNVKVLDSFAELDKSGSFKLTYNINAGELHYFNDLKLNLPDDYNAKDFKKIENYLLKLKGEKYSINNFQKILSDIENIAVNRLYDFIDAEVEEEVVNGNKINFAFNVSDSSRLYVEEVNIIGNYTTIEEVIRNKLIVDEGDPLNEILFNKSINNIRALGIFKNVNSEIKDGSNENLKKIDIVVDEKPTGEISLAAGVGTSGSSIGGGIVEKNFLGKGINLNTNLVVSESSIKGQFIYSKPNFAYSDNTLSTSLTSTTTDNLADYGYKVSEIGASVGTEFEQYENLFFSPGIRTSLEDLETNSSASSTLRKQDGNYTDIYFDYGLSYDLRDSQYKPSSGSKTNFYQELPLISDSNEIANTFIFTQYKKLSNQSYMTGKASLYLKTITSFNDDVRISKRGNVPYSRLRGFESGKIGPIENNDYIGGNYISALNLSTNLPFILPTVENVDFSYFIDAANVWGVDYDSSIDDSNTIRSSTGIGMNLTTPVGPLSFSFSQPLTKKSTDKTESFRFNLGTTF